MASVDDREFRTFARDLRSAPSRVQGQVFPIIFKGAMAIKKQMQAEMGGSGHFKGTTPAIDFDITNEATSVTAEIGPKVGSGEVGGLGSIAYFGGANGGGGTVPDPELALKAEAEKIEKVLGDILGDAL